MALFVFAGSISAQEHPAQVQAFAPATASVEATGFDGALLIHKLHSNTWLASHPDRIDRPLLPASTFKIFSALVALEAGVIADKSALIRWDGVRRGREETNQDLHLQAAFRLSAVPHFQFLVRQIGPPKMQHYIDLAGYGNRNISGGEDTFWLTGQLRISARQQIGMLRRLYLQELPFSAAAMKSVKEMMLTEETDEYAIHAKTGWAMLDSGDNTGWWVGWLEGAGEVYFFAGFLQAVNPGSTFAQARMDMVRDTFRQMGLLGNQE